MGKRNSRIDSLSDDDLYKKWQADLEALKNRAYRLASAEETFRQTRSVAQVSPVLQKHPHLWEWMALAHIESSLMRVRTFLDSAQQKTPSFLAMLKEMVKHGERVLTRTRFLETYEDDGLPHDDWHRIGNEHFEQFAPRGSDAVPAVSFRTDLDDLDRAVGRLKVYVSQAVAHPKGEVSGPQPKPLSWKDYDSALDTIFEMVKKYYALLHQAGLMSIVPSVLDPWKRVYAEAWLPTGVGVPAFKSVDDSSECVFRTKPDTDSGRSRTPQLVGFTAGS